MSTTAHQDDVVNLAAILLGVANTAEAAAYRPGELFFNVLQTPLDFDELTVDIAADTSNLPAALAVLAAVQLSIDAAAAAVEYRFRTQEGEDDDPARVIELLRKLSDDRGWDLDIVELSAGSIRAKLRKILNSPDDRKKALAVATLAGAVLSGIFGGWPAAIPGIIVAALALGDVYCPQAAPPPDKVVIELAQRLDVAKEEINDLKTKYAKLVDDLKKPQLGSVDTNAAVNAQVQQQTITVAQTQAA